MKRFTASLVLFLAILTIWSYAGEMRVGIVANAGSANDLTCTGCVSTTDIADDTIAAADLNFNYAGSSSEGGAATTATALAANGSNCSFYQAAAGVDASGVCEAIASQTKALVAANATAFMRIDIASGTACTVQIRYEMYAADATNQQQRSGSWLVSCVNEGGTEACATNTQADIDNSPTGTSTLTLATDTTPTNGVNITANATSSLTETTLNMNYGIQAPIVGACTVTAL